MIGYDTISWFRLVSLGLLIGCATSPGSRAARVSHGEISATVYSSESQRVGYLEDVKKRIIRNWSYPEKAKQNKEEGMVVLLFTILQDGSLENIRVQRSSGFASLDKAAMGRIVSAVPFDSIPEQIGQTTMEVKFTFNYKLTETEATLGDTKDSLPRVEPPKADPPPQIKISKKDSEESPALPIKLQKVDDDEVQAFVINEASSILSVTRHSDEIDLYTFYLTKFKVPNVRGFGSGFSVGNHVIYIDYNLAKTALTEKSKINLLRIELAHQIAHDISGHDVMDQLRKLGKINTANDVFSVLGLIPYVNLAAAPFALGMRMRNVRLVHEWNETELEADQLGIKYWKDLGWDCSPWPRQFEARIDELVKKKDYFISNSERKRLRQAGNLCLAASERKDLEVKFQQWQKQIQERRKMEREMEREEREYNENTD